MEITHSRVSAGELIEQSKEAAELFKFNDLLGLVPDIVMILNSQRQIIYSNQNLMNFLDVKSFEEIIGKRAGEVFNCIHAFDNDLGCGTTEFCKECGAHQSILSSLNYQNDIKECRIIQRETRNALDLKVWTNPIVYNGSLYILFSLRDISDQKRKEVLERIFFHDILNTATSIKAIMELMNINENDEKTNYKNIMKDATSKLLEEIYSQRQLLEAESLTLTLDISAINSINLIQGVIDLVRYYDFSRNVTIELSSNSQEFELLTDSTLLRRVLTNLLKNACEAEYPDGNVNIGCIKQDYNAYFWVNNKSVMPKDVQLQLFQRSFSTKGKGRGVGTYSVKLLTEKYLRGSVDFYSNEEKGTLFNLYIPLTYEN